MLIEINDSLISSFKFPTGKPINECIEDLLYSLKFKSGEFETNQKSNHKKAFDYVRSSYLSHKTAKLRLKNLNDEWFLFKENVLEHESDDFLKAFENYCTTSEVTENDGKFIKSFDRFIREWRNLL